MDVGTLAAIWRYPVKSLRGLPLAEAVIETTGLEGDRTAAYIVNSAGHQREGKPFRGKENDRLHVTPENEVPAYAAQAGIAVERREGDRFFDAAPVSLIVDRWLETLSAHVGYPVEPQRFRPNLFVRAANGFSAGEADLEGRELNVGGVVLRVRCPIERCVVTTYHPDGNPSDPRILRFVAQQRNTWMGVYCDVVTPGRVHAGDRVTSS